MDNSLKKTLDVLASSNIAELLGAAPNAETRNLFNDFLWRCGQRLADSVVNGGAGLNLTATESAHAVLSRV